MPINCSICLNLFKEPVCLPCGHIYCSKCLSDHINALPSKEMTASCPDCRTNFNIFTPELACLPRQYHQFIIPSVRRVYLDLLACSALQGKLEKAETRLRLHKNHEDALTKQCESLSAALDAHRAGESKALHATKALKTKLAAYVESHQNEIDDHTARYQQLEQEHQLLQGKYTKIKLRCQQLNEEVLAYKVEQEEQSQAHVNRSGPDTPPLRGLAMELRAMKPLPKRRVTRRTRSISPPPVHGKLVKRPRISEGTRLS